MTLNLTALEAAALTSLLQENIHFPKKDSTADTFNSELTRTYYKLAAKVYGPTPMHSENCVSR